MSKQKMRVKVVKPWPSLFVLVVFGVFALLQPLFECRPAFVAVMVLADFGTLVYHILDDRAEKRI